MKNTPYEERSDDDDDYPFWSKMVLHVEVDAKWEYLITDLLEVMKKSGEYRRAYGEFAWPAVNPGPMANAPRPGATHRRPRSRC